MLCMGKRRAGRKFQNSYSRKLARAITDAGGQYTLTANGHFRVTNPRSPSRVAFVSGGESCGRVRHKALADIRRETGLVVAF
jgi:hypothetical protein